MSVQILTPRFTPQPRAVQAFQVPPSEQGFWSGLVFCALPGAVPFDLVSGGTRTILNAGSTSLQKAEAMGWAHYTTDFTNSGIYYPWSERWRTITRFQTLVYIGLQRALTGASPSLYTIPFAAGAWASPFQVNYLLYPGSAAFEFGYATNGTTKVSVTSDVNAYNDQTATAGNELFIGITRDGPTVTFYGKGGRQVGAQKTLGTDVANFWPASPGRDLSIHNRSRYSVGNGMADAGCYFFALWNRALAPTEMGALYRDPFRFIRPRRSSVRRPAMATLGGTALAGINESDIVTGGKTITITLTGRTWIP